MADTLWNIIKQKEITPDIIKITRIPNLTQVVNIGLNGLVHIQNIGSISYQITAEIAIHKSKEVDLFDAFMNGDLVKIVDDDNEYRGYIISVKPDDKGYIQGYHKMTIILQQEVVE